MAENEPNQNPEPAQPPPNNAVADAIKTANFARDEAVAKAAKLAQKIADLEKQVPSPEQAARLAELEKQAAEAEEARIRKTGEFDAWRKQTTDKFEQDKSVLKAAIEESKKQAEKYDNELNATLVGLAFAGASDLFGPASKTVLLPAVAQAYFGKHVTVEKDDQGNRAIVVRDANGNTIVDTKTGKTADFATSMAEIIAAHPDKDFLLRGSGKSGSNTPGGSHFGPNGLDLTKLKSADFARPEVREALREQAAKAGGMQIGSAFDRARK
jgi:flagellar motor protein MotB